MPPVDIDDLQLKRTLNVELTRRVESGQTVPLEELLRRIPESWSGVDVAPASSQESAPEEIYRSACSGMVAVGKLYRCSKCRGRHTSIASGFVIASSGVVITSLHVVDDPGKETLGIMTHDGSVYPVQSVLKVDRPNDLAVLQVAADDLVPLPVGHEPSVGATVYVLSHPAGRLFTFTAGIVSRYTCHGESSLRLMAITADFGRGSSGAPVLDTHGAVVGVARQTKSIYFHPEGDTPPRLQMVLKHGVPSGALWDLGLRQAAD